MFVLNNCITILPVFNRDSILKRFEGTQTENHIHYTSILLTKTIPRVYICFSSLGLPCPSRSLTLGIRLNKCALVVSSHREVAQTVEKNNRKCIYTTFYLKQPGCAVQKATITIPTYGYDRIDKLGFNISTLSHLLLLLIGKVRTPSFYCTHTKHKILSDMYGN